MKLVYVVFILFCSQTGDDCIVGLDRDEAGVVKGHEDLRECQIASEAVARLFMTGLPIPQYGFSATCAPMAVRVP